MIHPGDLLSAYFDDELMPDERQAVAAHLDDCTDCRDELTAIQTAAVAVRALPMLDPPAGLVPAGAPWRRRRRLQALGVAAAGVTALVALVVGVAVIGSDDTEPQLSAADTVPVVLPGLERVPRGDATMNGQQRVQAINAALTTMSDAEEMDMASDDTNAEAEVMMDDEPLMVRSGLWEGVAGEYLALMDQAEGVVGLWVANQDGKVMTFFYCQHSWYRVEKKSGQVPDLTGVVELRSALGCSG